MKILVTGASGFIGSALVKQLVASSTSFEVVAAVRDRGIQLPSSVDVFANSDLSLQPDWTNALKHVDCVVHCAARVHVMHDYSSSPLEAYRRVNVQGTLCLAQQAAQLGVRRFVFLSSVKVNGELTLPGNLFTADDIPAPIDFYGLSKMEAELGLREIEKQMGMEVVIVRPPLVYGPGVKANFSAMMRWVARGVPMPLGAIHNTRSLVALDNLVDLLITCIKKPEAAGQNFLVSDGEDVSTTELLHRLAQAMGKRTYLFPVPASMLALSATLLGKRMLVQRLCGSLQVDINKTRSILSWTPPLTLDQGLKKAVEGMKT